MTSLSNQHPYIYITIRHDRVKNDVLKGSRLTNGTRVHHPRAVAELEIMIYFS